MSKVILWPQQIRVHYTVKTGGEEVPPRRAGLHLSNGSGWFLSNKQQMSSAMILYNFKNIFMETVPFDFTALREYACQLLLFPLSDENTRAQIIGLVQIQSW